MNEDKEMIDNFSDEPENNESAEAQSGETKNRVLRREIIDWIEAIVFAVVITFLLKNFVFTLVKVDGSSMEPTLYHENRLYVNKFFYTPEKGDIIIFTPESDPERPYVKRVIATEGDTVYIDFGTGDVYVNDRIIEENYIAERTHHMGSYKSYIQSLMLYGEYSRENPIVIEKDKVFVMGDNRNASKDSRDLGQIPVDDIMGHALFRFWPLDKFGGLE